MLVIGLTGGIGSGKSTVARLFAEKGVTIIDTDQLARDITLPGQEALAKIIEKFGKGILLPDKTLDRSQLRKIVFTDLHKRQWLEQLLHPLIRAETQRRIESATSPYCMVVIPLLLETKPNPLVKRILVVDLPEEQQLLRAHLRDQLPEKEISAIMRSQVTREQRLAAADDVIDNHGTLAELIPQVEKLHQSYCNSSTPLPSS